MDDAMDAGLVVEEIWISSAHDFRGRHGIGRKENETVRVDEVECVTGMGLEGDRYFGFKENYKGQVTFFAMEIIDELREKYGDVPSSVVRRNVMVRGGGLKRLLGKQFAVQGVVFEGSEECRPCYWMDEAVGPGAEDFLMGECRGGIRARIVRGGRLQAADSSIES